MSEIYKTIADGYEQLAAAFRSLASATEDPQKKVNAEITFEDLKDVLGALSLNGKREQVKALLLKYDSGKLSGVKKEDYPALMADARAL